MFERMNEWISQTVYGTVHECVYVQNFGKLMSNPLINE